jgi:hypothetical protein
MASCDTKLSCVISPSIGTKGTRGASVGTNEVLGDGRSLDERLGARGGGLIGGDVPMEGMNLRSNAGAIAGTL